MNRFKAVCKFPIGNIEVGDVCDIHVNRPKLLINYGILHRGVERYALNSVEFHRYFRFDKEEGESFQQFLEGLRTVDLDEIDEYEYEIVEEVEEPDYYSEKYMLSFDIVDAIQSVVQSLQNRCFAEESEDGDLQFIVSCLYEEDKEGELSFNKIILTIKHHRYTNSRVLFPSGNAYGSDYLVDVMRSMYNQTM